MTDGDIIHGLVRVDGYVNGDGTITLNNAAFLYGQAGIAAEWRRFSSQNPDERR